MIGLLLNRYAIGGILTVAVISSIYLKGRSDDAASHREQAVKATQAQISERSKTDAKVSKMDLPALCGALGGVMHDGQCL